MSGASHDRKAEFEAIALPYLDALFNLALNLTRNRKDAEDLVQETYLRAYRFFDSYKPGTHIKAWLFRILRNAFINRYRAKKIRPQEVDFSKVEMAYEAMVDEDYLQRRRAPSPDAGILDGVLDEQVQTALDGLQEEYRTVVVMALVEEMSYREIAAALSIPLGTVMSRLHRGRRLLQAALLEYARDRGIIRPPAGVGKSGESGGDD